MKQARPRCQKRRNDVRKRKMITVFSNAARRWVDPWALMGKGSNNTV